MSGSSQNEDHMIPYHGTAADEEYGIPEQKKFPLDSRGRVLSAIRFFNYADSKYRKELASRIIRKIHEYKITGLTPSDRNAFYNYYHPQTIVHSGGDYMNNYYAIPLNTYLEHSGIKGQKWGVRRYQNSDGSLTAAGRERYAKSEARTTYKLEGLKRKQEKTKSFDTYKKLNSKINRMETKERRKQDINSLMLTTAERNWGKYSIATSRVRRKTIRTGAIVAASIFGVASTGGSALAIPAAVGGVSATAISARKIPYYAKERHVYKNVSTRPTD